MPSALSPTHAFPGSQPPHTAAKEQSGPRESKPPHPTHDTVSTPDQQHFISLLHERHLQNQCPPVGQTSGTPTKKCLRDPAHGQREMQTHSGACGLPRSGLCLLDGTGGFGEGPGRALPPGGANPPGMPSHPRESTRSSGEQSRPQMLTLTTCPAEYVSNWPRASESQRTGVCQQRR